jgi:hypothetical protein
MVLSSFSNTFPYSKHRNVNNKFSEDLTVYFSFIWRELHKEPNYGDSQAGKQTARQFYKRLILFQSNESAYQRSITMVCAYQRSITMVCIYQRSTTMVCTYQRSTTMVCTYQRSTTMVCTYQRSTTTVCTYQRSTTMVCNYQRSATMVCTYQRSTTMVLNPLTAYPQM